MHVTPSRGPGSRGERLGGGGFLRLVLPELLPERLARNAEGPSRLGLVPAGPFDGLEDLDPLRFGEADRNELLVLLVHVLLAGEVFLLEWIAHLGHVGAHVAPALGGEGRGAVECPPRRAAAEPGGAAVGLVFVGKVLDEFQGEKIPEPAGYIEKPAEPEELLELINQCLAA